MNDSSYTQFLLLNKLKMLKIVINSINLDIRYYLSEILFVITDNGLKLEYVLYHRNTLPVPLKYL